jgi:N-methylhydantoinase B
VTPDPVTLEVVRNGVYAIAEEMRVIVMRSARSPLLKEAGDLSCVLTDARGRLIAQGSKDNLMHLGVMGFTVKEFLKRVPAERLRDGDVYYTNLPAIGGNHLPDVKAIRPIFHRGRLVAFAVNLSHWPDVGGALPGSYVTWATEIYQEGLQIAPIRLFDRDGPIEETLEFVLANVRGRPERRGDIFAQRASADVAAQLLTELFDRYGAETVLACFERFLDESEALMRAALRELPDGTYEGEDFLDDDGLGSGPIRIAAKITIEGDHARFDFGGSSPQVPGPVNTTYFITCSGVYYACKALLGPEIPPNEGCYRALEVVVPPGSVLNAGPEAAVVGGNHETSQRVADALFRAFAQVLPERVVAGGITSAGIALISGRWPDGRPFVFYETHGGGSGAGHGRDGANAVRVHMSNVMNTPTEAVEAEYPLLVERHELREGSGGAGRRRGGLGLRRAYRVLNPQARLTTMIERCKVPPWGLFGGSPGALSRVTLLRGGQPRPVGGKETLELARDDVVLMETAGGGGYGDPAERDPALVEQDRREGYIEATHHQDTKAPRSSW